MAATAVSAQQLPDASSPGNPGVSWEGERMFNIYIYDYCTKRGFRKTADQLLEEANIPADSTPPINARQGLLFEWWSVFWVLFSAKSNGNGSDDAMLYTQHQTHQSAQRQAAQRIQQQSQQGAQPPPGQQPPMARLVNGTVNMRPHPQPQAGGGFLSNGIMPTGNAPPVNQFPMSNNGPQTNGIHPGSQAAGAPAASGGPPTGQQPQANMPNTFPHIFPNRRESMNQPNPRGSFNSPTMAHSPQAGGGPPPQPQQPGHPQQAQQPSAPMGQLGPSPHMQQQPGMNRSGVPNMGMLPPNANPGQPPHTPTTAYRPPSRNSSPAQRGGGIMPSPSMVHRQVGVPGMNQPQQQPPLGIMGVGMPPGTGLMPNPENIIAEFMRIPNVLVGSLKNEIGLGDKDPQDMNVEDKQRIVQAFRVKTNGGGMVMGGNSANRTAPKPGIMPGTNATAGPSGMPQHPRSGLPGQPGPQVQSLARNMKRNSTSPGQEADNLPRNDQSPPDRKRPRRSPLGMESAPGGGGHGGAGSSQSQTPIPNPMNATYPIASPQPPPNMMPGPGGMRLMNNGGSMAHFGGPPPGPPDQGQQMGGGPMMMPMNGMSNMGLSMGQQMMNAANPGMGHPGGGPMMPRNVMTPQMQQQFAQQFRRAPGPNIGSPAAGGDSSPFNPGGGMPGGGLGISNPRAGQNKPMTGMMPPPSPAAGAGPKDPKDGLGQSKNAADSPRPGPGGHQQGMPGGPGTSSTPVPNPGSLAAQSPSANSQQQQQQQQQQSGPGGPGGLNGLGMSQQQQQPPSAPSAADLPFLSNDFLSDVTQGLDGFDNSLFRTDGDINFERDFGQWFNPDTEAPGLDLP